MSQPICRVDPALEIIATVQGAVADQFAPHPQCPPKIGATEHVRFLAGDGAPLASWDIHASGADCAEPFIWVRTMRRYRSRQFPNATISITEGSVCSLPRVIAVEIGVAWCAAIGDAPVGQLRLPSWEELETEALNSQDTAWRLENALCVAAGRLTNDDAGRSVGVDTLLPYGPEGGIIAWSGMIYASY